MKPQRDRRTLLADVVTACEKIEVFTAGHTFDDYAHDDQLRSAVERQFTIIGEALREAWKLDRSLSAQITGFRSILNFRNVLVHGYSTVFDAAVWDVIHNHLPLLLRDLRPLFTELPPGELPA
ncbi:MAG TPA: HepT-like ribonuclease domain-containing protein [Thermoanaerobaculia bacterium]|nr:HepT-like ribonuclease domain-containing protein [Thermoanaerobaculia bacterium]